MIKENVANRATGHKHRSAAVYPAAEMQKYSEYFVEESLTLELFIFITTINFITGHLCDRATQSGA